MATSIGTGFKLYCGMDRKRNGVGVIPKEEQAKNVVRQKECLTES